MTKDNQLKVALKALQWIADGNNEDVCGYKRYASQLLKDITAPKMKTVEVKAWKCVKCGTYYEAPLSRAVQSHMAEALYVWVLFSSNSPAPTSVPWRRKSRRCGKVKNQPPDLTAGEFNRGE